MINNTEDGSTTRLKEIRKALKMTQIEFAEIINSSNGHVSDMEKGRKNITESTMDLLKLKKNVNIDWLKTGKGEMFIKLARDEQISEFVGGILTNESDSFKKRLISVLANLTEEEWKILEKKAKELINEKRD